MYLWFESAGYSAKYSTPLGMNFLWRLSVSEVAMATIWANNVSKTKLIIFMPPIYVWQIHRAKHRV